MKHPTLRYKDSQTVQQDHPPLQQKHIISKGKAKFHTLTCAHVVGKSFIRRPERNDHKLFMYNVVYDNLHHYFLCAHYGYQYKTETGYPHIQVQE